MMGRRTFSTNLDVRDHTSIQTAVAAVEEHFGHIDILVNNAGCNIRKPALDVTWEDWNTILDTNLRGSFFVAQAVARGMVQRAYGRIINIGSVTSVAGYAGLGPYGASRGGIRQLTMSLADDWGSKGVTVNCLAPGWFRTQQKMQSGSNTLPIEFQSNGQVSLVTSTVQSSFSLRNPADTLRGRRF